MSEQLTSITPVVSLLEHPPLGLFSDIDGTLAPIVAQPEDARVTLTCRELLSELISSGVVVVLLTGRTIGMARLMTGLDNLTYAANHGLTIWMDGHEETPGEVDEFSAIAQEIFKEARGIDHPGVFVELTGPNVALHYRNAIDEEGAQQAIRDLIAVSPSARRYRVHEGRKVIELRPPIELNKGTALLDLVERLNPGAVICLGDDTTDLDMFRAAKPLHERGLLSMNLAVQSDEAVPDLFEESDYWLPGVPGVEWFLRELSHAVRERPS